MWFAVCKGGSPAAVALGAVLCHAAAERLRTVGMRLQYVLTSFPLSLGEDGTSLANVLYPTLAWLWCLNEHANSGHGLDRQKIPYLVVEFSHRHISLIEVEIRVVIFSCLHWAVLLCLNSQRSFWGDSFIKTWIRCSPNFNPLPALAWVTFHYRTGRQGTMAYVERKGHDRTHKAFAVWSFTERLCSPWY